jgi:hypothetical protein
MSWIYAHKLEHIFTQSLTQHFLFFSLVLLITKATYTTIMNFVVEATLVGQQWNGVEHLLPFTVACSERAVHLFYIALSQQK